MIKINCFYRALLFTISSIVLVIGVLSNTQPMDAGVLFEITQEGCPGDPVSIGDDAVYAVDVQYDYPEAGESTWYYCIEASLEGIDAVTFMLESCLQVVDQGIWSQAEKSLLSDAGMPEFTAGSLMFGEDIVAGEVRGYYFTLDDNYENVALMDVALQGATESATGTLLGPACSLILDDPTIAQTNEVIPDEDAITIGGRVWSDSNMNSLQDPGEIGIANVEFTLWLYSQSDQVPDKQLTSTTSNFEGVYRFEGLNPKQYYTIQVKTPSGYYWTKPNNGLDDTLDNDFNPFSRFIVEPVLLKNGEFKLDIDAGFINPKAFYKTATPGATVIVTETPTIRPSSTPIFDPPTSTPMPPTPTATICPVPTQEFFDVEFSSPTTDLTQSVTVRIGNGESVTITGATGVFSATGTFDTNANPALIDVTLLPDQANTFLVEAVVREIMNFGCTFGGYTLSRTIDIEQVTETTPTVAPTETPTLVSTGGPTEIPTDTPVPTETPTFVTTGGPTEIPTGTLVPTDVPTDVPTEVATDAPTDVPTEVATDAPTDVPTEVPTDVPTDVPTEVATDAPTDVPTEVATDVPTDVPTEVATDAPTDVPTEVPTDVPTGVPTEVPTDTPTPTEVPTEIPTEVPTDTPTPTDVPTDIPTAVPTLTPTPASGITDPLVFIGTYTAMEAEEFVVIVESMNLDGLATATIEVIYDPNILEAVNCSKDPDSVFDLEQCNVAFRDNIIRFNVTSLTGVSGDIPLAEVTFRVIGSNGQTSELGVNLPTFANSNGGDIEAVARNGSAAIAAARLGDVTCDDERTPVDALFMLQHELGLREATEGCEVISGRSEKPFNLDNCDVSRDGKCNAVDTLMTLQCDVGIRNTLCPAHVKSRKDIP